ncbi:MAG: hypothetical protein OQJ96_04795 [Flavobacteriales bacterium]|nr:hypothetical protein [Flavobacteriales bacterium]MCW8913638.1 hypothetical protein [Flavobacteriales bacterium]MCW8937142.1 hypothetical protein [Flavobacteriales bacterium]MCW8941184.1 hypothetical protein [Flavobacteriales bacterium]MCW8968320.1 hypothetical protein [Flavobacteriales bacterium]
MIRTLIFLFVFITYGKSIICQEVNQNIVKPDWNGFDNFHNVLKQKNVDYKEERKVYYFDFDLNPPKYVTQEIFGDSCLSSKFKDINHNSGFRLSKSDKSYWYYILLINDSVCILDDKNIKDFLTPINSIEKLITYFYYEVNIVPDKDYNVFDKYVTIEEDGFSFLVLDMDNKKSSRFNIFRIIDFEYERTPLLKIKIYSNGQYTFEKIKINRETRNLKHAIIDPRYF